MGIILIDTRGKSDLTIANDEDPGRARFTFPNVTPTESALLSSDASGHLAYAAETSFLLQGVLKRDLTNIEPAPSNTVTFLGQRLTNAGAPVNAGDAATKGYVDSRSATRSLNNVAPVAPVSFNHQSLVDLVDAPDNPTSAVTTQALQTALDAAQTWARAGADVFRAAGRVGVGTATPQAALDVSGTIAGGVVQLTGDLSCRDVVAAAEVRAARFVGDGAGLTNVPLAAVVPVAKGGTGLTTLPANKLLVGAGGTDPVTAPAPLHWDAATGRLGIHTAAPAEALHVVGAVRAGAFKGDGSDLTSLTPDHLAAEVPVAKGGTGQSALAPDKLLVGRGAAAVLTPSDLHWDAGARRLGINTSAPAATLDVAGDVSATSLAVSDRADLAAVQTGSLTVGAAGDAVAWLRKWARAEVEEAGTVFELGFTAATADYAVLVTAIGPATGAAPAVLDKTATHFTVGFFHPAGPATIECDVLAIG